MGGVVADASVLRPDVLDHRPRAIGARVVDDEDLVVDSRSLERLHETVDGFRNRSLFVVGRDDRGDLQTRAVHCSTFCS